MRTYAAGRITVDRLPETRDLVGAKRWVEEKGEFAQIAYGEVLRHIAFFSLHPGYWRGNHYHSEKSETFYVIRGSMRGTFLDMDTGEKVGLTVEAGDKVHIEPGIGHIFYGLEETLVVEYSPQEYVARDTFKLDLEERT